MKWVKEQAQGTVLISAPPLSILTPLIPLFLLSLILIRPASSHPQLRPTLGSVALLLLSNSAQYHFEPREKCIGINIVLAIIIIYGAMKAVEWGFMSYGKEEGYNYVGFKKDDSPSTKEKMETPLTTPQLIFGALHLLTSMRGYGYSFSLPHPRPPPHSSYPSFILQTLRNLFLSHLLFLATASIFTSSLSSRLSLTSPISHSLSFSPNSHLILTETISFVCWGISAYAGLLMVYSTLCILFLLLHSFFHLLFPHSIAPFNTSEYPPLFERPYLPLSIIPLWSHQWHTLFRHSFFILAYNPTQSLFSLSISKPLGITTIFLFSAFIHELAIRIAIHTIPLRNPRVSFVQKWGATTFFLSMAAFAILEKFLQKGLGWKFGRTTGFLYAALAIGSSAPLLYFSWSNLQVTDFMPGVERWGWQRWLAPLACVAPDGYWVK